MPLLKFTKKRGGYNFSDSDFYVIEVQLLDGSNLQCTLKLQSTGEDCMAYIMQKLELQQNLYFGLRYKCTQTVYRWVDLKKPLKKQLMKQTYEFKLYFSVMFYTAHPECISHDSERYYYYLQMRSDILNGRLLGTPEKAILCASYSLQAEFGDYNPAKQTDDLLKNFTLLPLHMTKSAQILEEIMKEALKGHEQLRGISQAQAELAYIREARNFDGYGEEYFPAKDDDGTQFYVGHSVNGVIVKRIQSPPVVHSWKEIKCIFTRKHRLCVDISELNRITFKMDHESCAAEYAAFVFGKHLEFYQKFDFVNRNQGNTIANQNHVMNCNYNFVDNRLPQNTTPFHNGRQSGLPSNNSCGASSPLQVSNAKENLRHPTQMNSSSIPDGNAMLMHYSHVHSPPSYATKVHNTDTRSSSPNSRHFPSKDDLAKFLPAYTPAPDYETVIRSQSAMCGLKNGGTDEYNAIKTLPLIHLPDMNRLSLQNVARTNRQQEPNHRFSTVSDLSLKVLPIPNGHVQVTSGKIDQLATVKVFPNRKISPQTVDMSRFSESLINEFMSLQKFYESARRLSEVNTLAVGGEPINFLVQPTPRDSVDLIGQFWNTVWAKKVEIIVALDECSQYLHTFPGYSIQTEPVSISDSFVVSCLQVSPLSRPGESRLIRHVQYKLFSRCLTDSIPAFSEFYDAVCEVQNEVLSKRTIIDRRTKISVGGATSKNCPNLCCKQSAPFLVHCRSGVGWSGVFLAACFLIKCREQNEALLVPDAISKLRQSTQLNLVPIISEYSFLCSFYSYFCTKWRLV